GAFFGGAEPGPAAAGGGPVSGDQGVRTGRGLPGKAAGGPAGRRPGGAGAAAGAGGRIYLLPGAGAAGAGSPGGRDGRGSAPLPGRCGGGMGSRASLTGEAEEAFRQADAILAAG